MKNSGYIQDAVYIWIEQNTYYPRDKRVRVPLVNRNFLNKDTNYTESSALKKPALQHAYPTTGENKHGAGGSREGNQLLANEFTIIEKRLNFHLQRVDENQQPLMAGDATFPVKSTSAQVGQKQFSS